MVPHASGHSLMVQGGQPPPGVCLGPGPRGPGGPGSQGSPGCCCRGGSQRTGGPGCCCRGSSQRTGGPADPSLLYAALCWAPPIPLHNPCAPQVAEKEAHITAKEAQAAATEEALTAEVACSTLLVWATHPTCPHPSLTWEHRSALSSGPPDGGQGCPGCCCRGGIVGAGERHHP